MRASPVGRQGGAAPDAPASEGEVRGLARELVEEAIRRGVTLATAESCTGGLVAGAITAIPGSSGALLGGIVSYAIPVKAAVLGVGTDILDAPGVGAVSSECAAAMCEGARRVICSDLAVSVTGIAGPGGAEPGKPVGTVWFGVTGPSGTRTERQLFSGGRDEVRQKAVRRAIRLLGDYLS
jgi:nicotinamide-nucleotide amidase